MKSLIQVAAAIALFAGAVPAMAAQSFEFHGIGVVTYSTGTVTYARPTASVGTRVALLGYVSINYDLPYDYTGGVSFTHEYAYINNGSFRYSLTDLSTGEGVDFSSSGNRNAAEEGSFYLVNGRIAGVNLYTHDFTGDHDLGYGASDFDFGSNTGYVSGDILLSVPEPSSWALLIVGFGLTGLAVRRRFSSESLTSGAQRQRPS
jgi:hypothetical protein